MSITIKHIVVMTKIFLDTEFTGLHQHTSLISIGLAAENGGMFYAEMTDFDSDQLNPWALENVLPLLSGNLRAGANTKVEDSMFVRGDQFDIGRVLRNWFTRFGGRHSVEIWADVLAWDWVLFCELFGGGFGIPEQIHYIPKDLSTLLCLKGIDPDTKREDLGVVEWSHPDLKLAKHHALYDALLEKSVYENQSNK
jgi:hypothetical protein